MSITKGTFTVPLGVFSLIRKAPNEFSPILGEISTNTELNIISQKGAWYEVQYNNQVGYILITGIKVTSSIPQSGISLNLGLANGLTTSVNAGEQPIFDWNARVISSSNIYIKNKDGSQTANFTSFGDHITILANNPDTDLTFIQYPNQSANKYQQGWIDSSYISSKYLDFRSLNTWTNIEDNQLIYLFNETISSSTLPKDSTYTLLYTISNFNINYSVILFEQNNTLEIGFVPSISGNLNFIVQDYPFEITTESSIGSYMPTVPLNAVIQDDIQLIDSNGIRPYWNYEFKNGQQVINADGTPSILYPTLKKGTPIAILKIFRESEISLIEYYNEDSNTYYKGYIPIEPFYTGLVSINQNSITWNNPNGTFNVTSITNTNSLYKLPATQTVNYLYSTDEFACILFNNGNFISNEFPYGPIQTGYVSLSEGTFKNATDIINDNFSAIAETLYFAQGNIVINVNIDSDTVFAHSLTKNLVLKATERSTAGVVTTVPVNWYSSNKDSYSGFQAVITPAITNTLLKNVNYNLYVQFTLNDSIIEIPIKNTIPVSLIHNNSFSLEQSSNDSLYLVKLQQSITTINQGKAIAMDGYWNSYGYTLNAQINLNNTISNTDKIMLTSLDKKLAILGTNVSWYSSNNSTYNGAQFIIEPTNINNVSSSEELFIDVYIGSDIYHMPLTSPINTNSENIIGTTYGILIENNDVSISKQ